MSENEEVRYEYDEEEALEQEIPTTAEGIYKAHLPPYLQESWASGRGNWYEEWLREQLDMLVMSEVSDWERLEELKRHKGVASLIFGIFGASFRILDHLGMHLRGQTLGQYELVPEDVELLRDLCQHFLNLRKSDLDLLASFLEPTEKVTGISFDELKDAGLKDYV